MTKLMNFANSHICFTTDVKVNTVSAWRLIGLLTQLIASVPINAESQIQMVAEFHMIYSHTILKTYNYSWLLGR